MRRSTQAQLERNHESRARQYALRERAVQLGWPAGLVSVVDKDLGRSGASTAGRLGFKELVAEVGLGHVGLILALETSRLARSSADWHQLLDLCALTATLIADADGIYSPAEFNDRLLLGLKGTMSEAELHLIRSRLQGGLRNKASRGELQLILPVGLDREERRADRARRGRAGPARDRPRVRAVAPVRLGPPDRRGAGRRGPAAAAPAPRRAARAMGAERATRPCTTCSPTLPMPARSCSAAPGPRRRSVAMGAFVANGASCRSRSGLSASAITIPAT